MGHRLASTALKWRIPGRWWGGYALALVGVALATVFIGLVLGRVQMANISMLYLIAVLAAAVAFGSGPAILASVAAFLAFDWFFVKPYFSITVADPDEWLTLLLFLLTAFVTGQLAAAQRQRAREAQEREREAVVLYDVTRIMSEPDLDQALRTVATRLCDELGLVAVVIDLTDRVLPAVHTAVGDPQAIRSIQSRNAVASHILSDGPAPSARSRGRPGTWRRIVPPSRTRPRSDAKLYRVTVAGTEQRAGTLSLIQSSASPGFGPSDDRLLSAVGVQLGLAVERARLRREATEAEIFRRADELKTALLNAVSHDLRTPLASIITAAGSLRQEDVTWTDEDRRDLARDIEQEALRLNRIVGNLLDLSRLEAGGLRPEKSWYDLGALIDDVIGRLRQVTSQHLLIVDIPEDLPPVPLDYVAIDQVVSNLIENAVRYTPLSTEIRITARRAGPAVRVEVADRGPGIPPAALPRLFEPFFRIATAAPGWRGTGLGLAVAKGLIEAHGGVIWVENRPDGGACFGFTLPLDATTLRSCVLQAGTE